VAQLVIDGLTAERHVTPGQEASRKRMLARTVPGLVSRHLAAPLAWRRCSLMARLPLLIPRYRRRFARAGDDPGLRDVSRRSCWSASCTTSSPWASARTLRSA
jgi:hypothetical protein